MSPAQGPLKQEEAYDKPPAYDEPPESRQPLEVTDMSATLPGPKPSSAGSDLFEFVLQSGTALHQTGDNFKFVMGDVTGDGQPDLVALKQDNTGTRSLEVHVMSGASGFQRFVLQTGTPLHETSTAQFEYALADWNGDGHLDLIVVKRHGTGTNSTEVHILSGASNFRTFLLQTGTVLHETDDTWAFAVGHWISGTKPDLFAIKKSKTGSNSTEVHILSGAADFQGFLLQTGTGLQETDATFDFAVTDWNADGRPDLVAIKKSRTSSKTTEVHVLSGASNFRKYILHSETALHRTDSAFDFAVADWTRNGRPDLVAIKKRNTASGSAEVQIMAG
jgi:hypothetical protein